MEKYRITITGISDLLMHKDNITWSESVRKWQKDPINKSISVAGDDRSPAWTWMGYTYNQDGLICIEADNLMSMFRDAGKKIPGEKPNSNLKSVTQSGIIVDQVAWPLLVIGKPVKWSEFDDLKDNNDFSEHEKRAKKYGFELFVKRAKVGQKKHVRVRPRFCYWHATGSITVTDKSLKKDTIKQILAVGGARVGLGDWRPGSPLAPGPFGKFESLVEKL